MLLSPGSETRTMALRIRAGAILAESVMTLASVFSRLRHLRLNARTPLSKNSVSDSSNSGRAAEKAETRSERLLAILAQTATRNGAIQYLPRPEVGTRLGKELGKLLLALAVVRGNCVPDNSDFATVVRVAEDCVPPNRMTVLHVLRVGEERFSPSDIERATGLPHSTATRTLEDLEVLGLAESYAVGAYDHGRKWKLLTDWKWAP